MSLAEGLLHVAALLACTGGAGVASGYAVAAALDLRDDRRDSR